jgi:hypothetical protein
VTSHIALRLISLAVLFGLTGLSFTVVFLSSPLYNPPTDDRHTPEYYDARLVFFIYILHSMNPLSDICGGLLIVSNPRKFSDKTLPWYESRIIEYTAVVLGLTQIACLAVTSMFRHDETKKVLSHVARFVITCIIMHSLMLRVPQMNATFSDVQVKKFVTTTLPYSAIGTLTAANYFAAEIAPCVLKFSPMFLPHNTDFSDPANSVYRCADAASSIYTLQCVIITAFYLGVYVAPYEKYDMKSIITFDVPGLHQFSCIAFLSGSLIACFMFGSHKDILDSYVRYFNDELWHNFTVRSQFNVFTRVTLATSLVVAIRGSEKRYDASGIVARPTTWRTPVLEPIRLAGERARAWLSVRNPTQLAPGWRVCVMLLLGACLFPAFFSVYILAKQEDIGEFSHGASSDTVYIDRTTFFISTTAAILCQPIVCVLSSIIFVSRPSRRSKLDTAFYFVPVLMFSVCGYVVTVGPQDVRFITSTASQLLCGISLCLIFPFGVECRGYLKSLPAPLLTEFLSTLVTAIASTIPTMSYLIFASFGCLSSSEASDELWKLAKFTDCQSYIQSMYNVMSNIMFGFIVAINIYTSERVSWKETVTLTGSGTTRFFLVRTFVQATTTLTTAAVFGSAAGGDNEVFNFANVLMRINFFLWMVCMFISARHVHKLIAIEKSSLDADDEEQVSAFAMRLKEFNRAFMKTIMQFSETDATREQTASTALAIGGSDASQNNEKGATEKKGGGGEDDDDVFEVFMEDEEKESSTSTERRTVALGDAPVLRISRLFQVFLVIPVVAPFFMAVAAFSLNLVRGSIYTHHCASMLLLLNDNLFIFQQTCALIWLYSDICTDRVFPSKMHFFVMLLPLIGASINSVNIIFLESRRISYTWATLPFFIGGIYACSIHMFEKMKSFHSRSELNNHILNEVAPTAVSVFPAILVLSSQHFACVVNNFKRVVATEEMEYTEDQWGGGYDGEIFGYYNNACEDMNYVTKPLIILIFTVAFIRVVVLPCHSQAEDLFSMDSFVTMKMSKFQYIRLILFSLLAGIAVFLYGAGAGDAGSTQWIHYTFYVYSILVIIIWTFEAINAVRKQVREVKTRREASRRQLQESTGGNTFNLDAGIEMASTKNLGRVVGGPGATGGTAKRPSVLLTYMVSAKVKVKKLKRKIALGGDVARDSAGGGSKEGREEDHDGEGNVFRNVDFNPGFI